jgi:hypothetical protein
LGWLAGIPEVMVMSSLFTGSLTPKDAFLQYLKFFVTFLCMGSKLQIHAEYDTLTGMDQGLWPRFYLQMAALGQLTIGQLGMDEKLEQIRTVLMPELEQLHRSYVGIQQGIQEYETGVASGKYYQVKTGGHTSLNRSVEF